MFEIFFCVPSRARLLNRILLLDFRKISILLYPVIPESALRVLSIFNVKETELTYMSIKNNNFLKPKTKIKKIEILFKKIEKK